MIVATTSLSIALWKRYSLIDVARWNSKKDAWQMLSLCCHMDNIRSRWTPRCLTDVLTGTQFPPMFAHSLSTKPTQDADPRGITSVILVSQACCYSSWLEHHQCMFEYRTEHSRTDQEKHPLTAQCRLHTCDSHKHGHKSHLTKAVSTEWTKLVLIQNPEECHTQEGEKWT